MRSIAVTMAAMLIAAGARAEGRWERTSSGCKVWIDDLHPEKTVDWSGSCKKGLADGRGVLVWSFQLDGKRFESRYEGRMEEGDMAGNGIYIWGNGNRYEGRFFEGMMDDDEATYTWANGDRYEGAFAKGEKDGRGIHVWANGNRYEGEFRKGLINGRGVYVWANGDRYEGEFRDGVIEGEGVYVWASGRKYEGTFRKGRPEE